jgi:hypothetical protein
VNVCLRFEASEGREPGWKGHGEKVEGGSRSQAWRGGCDLLSLAQEALVGGSRWCRKPAGTKSAS